MDKERKVGVMTNYEKGASAERECKRLLEWLTSIAGVCYDYDGYRTVDGLKTLVDDIEQMAIDAINGKPPYIKGDDD